MVRLTHACIEHGLTMNSYNELFDMNWNNNASPEMLNDIDSDDVERVIEQLLDELADYGFEDLEDLTDLE